MIHILRFIYFRLFPQTAINQVAWLRGFYPDDAFDPDDELSHRDDD